LIGDNLTPFVGFFQGLNIDLNQKQTSLLTMFHHGKNGKSHVKNMCLGRREWLSNAGININKSDFY